MKTRAPVISSILAGLGLLAGPVVARPKALAASSLIETLDGDNDWTLNLDEVTKARSRRSMTALRRTKTAPGSQGGRALASLKQISRDKPTQRDHISLSERTALQKP